MSPETVAALAGAGVGGAIGFLGQVGVLKYTSLRDRRAAAHVVFTELVTNFTVVSAALAEGAWPSLEKRPHRTAFDTYGVRLLTGRSLERVGHVVGAYNRVDELAWQWQEGEEKPGAEQVDEAILDIALGLYELGRVAGLTDRELQARDILTDEVRTRRDEIRELMKDARGGAWWRR